MKGIESPKVQVRSKVWLEAKGRPVLGPGRQELLQGVDEQGSISRASRLMKITYRKAWGQIRAMEVQLGLPLVRKQAGGRAEGGPALLTKPRNSFSNIISRRNGGGRQPKIWEDFFMRTVRRTLHSAFYPHPTLPEGVKNFVWVFFPSFRRKPESHMVDSCQTDFVCPLVFCFSHSFSHQCNQGDGGTGLIVRRLIILIFADWNRMTCLRHGSCPRSSIVSSAFALFVWIPRGFSQRGRVPPYALDVPPYVGDRTAPSPLLWKEGKASFPSFHKKSLYLHFPGNGPHESGKLTGNGGNDLVLQLPPRHQPAELAAESHLSLPGNIQDRLRYAFVTLEQNAVDPGRKAIGISGLHEDSANMSVARFGEAAPDGCSPRWSLPREPGRDRPSAVWGSRNGSDRRSPPRSSSPQSGPRPARPEEP